MREKPDKCCGVGTYNHSVALPINGRVHDIDFCIHHIVSALNAGGIKTVASCCGHGKIGGRIDLEDGKYLLIKGGKP